MRCVEPGREDADTAQRAQFAGFEHRNNSVAFVGLGFTKDRRRCDVALAQRLVERLAVRDATTEHQPSLAISAVLDDFIRNARNYFGVERRRLKLPGNEL